MVKGRCDPFENLKMLLSQGFLLFFTPTKTHTIPCFSVAVSSWYKDEKVGNYFGNMYGITCFTIITLIICVEFTPISDAGISTPVFGQTKRSDGHSPEQANENPAKTIIIPINILDVVPVLGVLLLLLFLVL